MKLFNLVQKPTAGQCDARRCLETDGLIPGFNHPQYEATLCPRHAKEFDRWAAKQPAEAAPAYASGLDPNEAPTALTISNPAPVLARMAPLAEQAQESLAIAEQLDISDNDSYALADQLVAQIFEDTKRLKKDKETAKKPLRDVGKIIDEWFAAPLGLYTRALDLLKGRMGAYQTACAQAKTAAVEAEDHDAIVEAMVEPAANTRVKVRYEYAVKNNGAALPLDLLAPDETRMDEIVKLLPRELLRPNYELIRQLVDEYGDQLDLPDIEIIPVSEVQMKGGRKCQKE